jgi:hypothetical protein
LVTGKVFGRLHSLGYEFDTPMVKQKFAVAVLPGAAVRWSFLVPVPVVAKKAPSPEGLSLETSRIQSLTSGSRAEYFS